METDTVERNAPAYNTLRSRWRLCLAVLGLPVVLMGLTACPPPAEQGVQIEKAPIEEVSVRIAESYPPQIFLYIKGGLRDSCTEFHDLTVERSGRTVTINVTTVRPKGADCAQVYSTFEKNVNLGSDFESGQEYTIKVNDKKTTFVMQ